MNTAYPERIAQVRELAGFSKTDLAEKLNVSVAAVSQWENGAKHPSMENLLALSVATNVQFQLLFTEIPRELLSRGPITFRARAAAKTNRLRKQAQRFAEMAAETFIWLERWVSFPLLSLPEISLDASPESAAKECRRAWGLGDRPISKLGELFESKGIRLCAASFGDVSMDAFSCVIGGRAFAFLGNQSKDRARCRFDAAHELGHLLRHQHLSDEDLAASEKCVEIEAHDFASCFLLPADTFSKDILDTSLEGFKRLKPKWGVSVAAMVRRAHSLGLISDATYDRHFRQMGALGWRRAKGEPMDDMVPPVNRILGKRSLELLQNGNQVKPWEITEALPLPVTILQSVFDADLEKAVPEELNNVIMLSDFLPAKSRPNAAA